ncbi:IS4 family transposase, partial [Streptomyces bambusae]|nr:IS4 family transposase [Streptomyces bambusae]
RWEIETAFLALRHTILTGHVLRSGDQPGIEQEVWALLLVHQLLRQAMVTAVETTPGTDPDRACFTTALQAARDQLTLAANVLPTHAPDLLGVIGRAVLDTLLPARRPRYSARKVKNPTSRYLNRGDGRPSTSTPLTAIDITVRTPPPGPPARHQRRRATRPPSPARPLQPPTRRERLMTIMRTNPQHSWHSRQLAEQLGITGTRTGIRSFQTQIAEWARLGFLHRTGQALYSLTQ